VSPGSEFDRFAETYEQHLARALAVSGEDSRYYARGRIEFLAACLREVGGFPRNVLDFGCGPGSSAVFFDEILSPQTYVGVDPSGESIRMANLKHAGEHRLFLPAAAYQPRGNIDLAYCNGVFHHIPRSQQGETADYVYRSLRPGGLFAFWENNPWNPGTRYVMARCEFDRDAVFVSPLYAAALLRKAGFEVLRRDFLFIFPRMLHRFRRWERRLAGLPVGAQYQILCRKPDWERL